MKKYIIGFILIALAGTGWLVYKAETVDYAQTVNNEVNHLESELVQQEVVIDQGGLTQGAATVARVRLITQLDIIWDTVELAEVTHVSKQQEFLLLKSLEQLEQILVDHGDTINTVEVTASPHFAEGDPQLDSILDKLQNLIDLLETHIRTVTPQTDSPSNNTIESGTQSAHNG